MILAAITQGPPVTPVPPTHPDLPPIKDIAPPVDVFPWPPWLVACVALVVLAILGAVVAAIISARKHRPLPPPPTPREIARRELEALREKVGRLDPYEFSIAVSDVLRTYIGGEFGLQARQQTSPEFLATIAKSVKFSEKDKTLLARFLERCDLIKFARIAASQEDSNELLASAIDFVEST
jgi:Domain of unknown function (DUF4381)